MKYETPELTPFSALDTILALGATNKASTLSLDGVLINETPAAYEDWE